jgi:hypothetical protein
MIKLSVGLISGDLVWLALESLIRQETSFDWELLISESLNKSQKELFLKYIPKLKEANCVQIKIIPIKSYPKHKHRIFNPSSDILVITEHDTFSHKTRLEESYNTKHNLTYTDYQLFYSPGKHTFVQQTDRTNYVVNNKLSGTKVDINREGFLVRKTTAPYLFQNIELSDLAGELEDRINRIKDIYSTLHFVYVYINPESGGPIWRELYYSVKSVQKFFKGLPYQIFVVGDNPKIKGVNHIPCERIKGKTNAKALDATKKLRKIVDSDTINDNFIYMYDDIVFLKNLTVDDFTPIIAHNHVRDINDYWGRGRKPSDNWIQVFNKTILKLKYHNLPTFNYETHLPRLLNKERVTEVLDKFKLEDNLYMFSTLYFNTFYTNPDILLKENEYIKADITIPYEDHNLDKYMKGRKFLNYNDMGLNKSLQRYIKKLFI